MDREKGYEWARGIAFDSQSIENKFISQEMTSQTMTEEMIQRNFRQIGRGSCEELIQSKLFRSDLSVMPSTDRQ
jgi:3-methyladenine DNA glycosylase Tag